MPKKRIGNVIFRKIRGKLVPIRITNRKIDVGPHAPKERRIELKTDKLFLGSMVLQVPKKGTNATLVDVRVVKEFRRKGLSKEMFKKAQRFLPRAGKKFLRSDSLNSAAQVKIRQALGKRTAFVGDMFGPFGEKKSFLTFQEAKAMAPREKNKIGRTIEATTKLTGKKFFRKKGRKF